MEGKIDFLLEEVDQGKEYSQRFKDKRRWQLAFRRYVLKNNPSEQYAIYFGLDSSNLRKWIELHFTEDVNWDNFGTIWQFDHIIPVTYFDFEVEEDLTLCWNFINIRIEKIELNKNKGAGVDILGAKTYFNNLYENTRYELCLKMLSKIDQLEVSSFRENSLLHDFILENKEHLEKVSLLDQTEFNRYNRGEVVDDILLEKEMFSKFA